MKLTARDLRTIRKNQKLSQEMFGSILNVSREMVSKMESGHVPVSAKTILKLHTLYGDELEHLSSARSVAGEGEFASHRKERGRAPIVWQGVPMYNLPLNSHFTGEWKQARLGMPGYYLADRNYMDCDFGAVIKGDQHVSDIRNGDFLLCQYIKDTGFLDFGSLYFVITTNGMEMCRYVHPHATDDNKLVLKASSKSVPDSPLPKKYISRLFRIRGILRGV